MLKNPQNPALLQEAQRYTEDFAAIKGIFEGLYIATPDTYVLTHTSQGAIGITTRSGDSLEEFQNTILAEPELTNLGIMKSPGTGSMILSMYYPIFDGRTRIGFVGAGLEWPHQSFPYLRGGGKRTGTGPVAGWYADGHKHTGSGACSGKISRRN